MRSVGTHSFCSRTVKGITLAVMVSMMLSPLEAAAEPPQTRTPAPGQASTAARPPAPAPPAASAQNTQVVVNGGVVSITYDLTGAATETFDVALEISQDGGQTYALTPKSVSGDVGTAIAPGVGKRIVWQAANDTDSLQTDRFRYRIVVTPRPKPATGGNATPAAAGTSPNTTPKAAPATPAAAPKKPAERHNALLWPSIGLMGGGVTVAALAASGSLRKCDAYDSSLCKTYDCCWVTNKPAVAAGGVMAITGGVLLILGMHHASSMPTVAIQAGGFTISKTVLIGDKHPENSR